jgi:hypothetical protein
LKKKKIPSAMTKKVIPAMFRNNSRRSAVTVPARQSLSVADVMSTIPRSRSRWTKVVPAPAPPTAPRKATPNKKYSCKQYSDDFVRWVNQMTDRVLAQPGRTMYITRTTSADNEVDQWVKELDGTEFEINAADVSGNKFTRIPNDMRCTGCRRFFKTLDPSQAKKLAYNPCECGVRKASHCVRCRVIQWALEISVDANGDVIPASTVKCKGSNCMTQWDPTDLIVVSYHHSEKE